MNHKKILETTRLELRELEVQDAAFILELMNTPGWLQFIGDRGLRSIEDAANYIQNRLRAAYSNLGFGFYLVELKEEKKSIGICGIIKRDGLEHVDIGFAFLPAFEGKGYAFESSYAMLNYAQNVLNIPTIAAITSQQNQRSIALLEKLGLKFERLIVLPNETEEIMLFLV